MQNFAQVPYSTKLGNLAVHYEQYQRIMQHWRAVLPRETVHDVVYEELVTNGPVCIEQLLAFCGLDYEPICDTFYSNRRRVDTASDWQVRQPLYSHSVGRWRSYERHLHPLQKLAQYARAEEQKENEAINGAHRDTLVLGHGGLSRG